jgi:hypothetical protein
MSLISSSKLRFVAMISSLHLVLFILIVFEKHNLLSMSVLKKESTAWRLAQENLHLRYCVIKV